MKNLFRKFKMLFLLGISLFLWNCQSTDEHYSHNEEVNNWIIQNKNKAIDFSRKQVASFAPKYHKAIMKLKSPQSKKTLWQDKVNYLMNLDLPKEEKEYLAWYGDKFKLLNYNKITPIKLEKQMYERALNGMKKFNWNKKFVYDMFFHLGDVNISSRYYLTHVDESSGGGSGGDETDCDCMYDLGCGWGNSECWTRNCQNPEEDCGFFGNSKCEGRCDIP